MTYLDLTEESECRAGVLNNRALENCVRRFRRTDHFGDPSIALDDCVRSLVVADLGKSVSGRICLLTHLRTNGYVVNPVSFYYCWNESQSGLDAIVAEVHNTPWGETHCYVLEGENSTTKLPHLFEKGFHVSPFMAMDQLYRWNLPMPAKELVVNMENSEDGNPVFDATLVMKRIPLTLKNLTVVRKSHPLMTINVIGSIYANAFRLWAKGCPYHPHPAKLAKARSPKSDTGT